MGRRLFASLGLAILVLVALPTAAVGASTAQASSGKDRCKDGGWRNLTGDQGRPFKNQGQCIKWQREHPVSLADLTGTFAGTESFTFSTNGCDFVHQVFDASYLGSAAVGPVTLHLEGCVINGITAYDGTFTIETSAGTLSGAASGPVTSASAGLDFELTLNVASATGAFSGLPGSLHVSLVWPGFPVTDITGSVST